MYFSRSWSSNFQGVFFFFFAFLIAKETDHTCEFLHYEVSLPEYGLQWLAVNPVAQRIKCTFNSVAEESHSLSELPFAMWVDFYFFLKFGIGMKKSSTCSVLKITILHGVTLGKPGLRHLQNFLIKQHGKQKQQQKRMESFIYLTNERVKTSTCVFFPAATFTACVSARDHVLPCACAVCICWPLPFSPQSFICPETFQELTSCRVTRFWFLKQDAI